MLTELKENELRERDQRIPKANPLPYTTDYPDVRTNQVTNEDWYKNQTFNTECNDRVPHHKNLLLLNTF